MLLERVRGALQRLQRASTSSRCARRPHCLYPIVLPRRPLTLAEPEQGPLERPAFRFAIFRRLARAQLHPRRRRGVRCPGDRATGLAGRLVDVAMCVQYLPVALWSSTLHRFPRSSCAPDPHRVRSHTSAFTSAPHEHVGCDSRWRLHPALDHASESSGTPDA